MKIKIRDMLQITAAILMTGGTAYAMSPLPKAHTAVYSHSTIQSKVAVTHVEAVESVVTTQPTVTWQDNPNHCTNAQWIAAPAPFACIDRPVATAPSAPADCGNPHTIMAAAGVSESDFGAVDYIISHEGSWCGATRWNTAGSGAYGICQSLPASKMANTGADWATNPVTQLKWCDAYATSRYGGWWPAQAYWVAHGNW